MYALLQTVWRSQKLALFYWGLSSALLLGYAWLYWNLDPQHALNICVLKNATGLPCPACGTTRSLEALVHGEWASAMALNPMGGLAAIGLLVLPAWLVYDAATKQLSLYAFYVQALQKIQQPRLALPLVVLVFTNWIWNIWKGL